MRNTWRHFFRRIAAVSTIFVFSALASAVCYSVPVASDVASNPVYDDGWQAGDNGGFGFGPWNFDGTATNNPAGGADLPDGGNQQAMDDGLKSGAQTSSTFNDIGRAWTLFNKKGRNVG